MIIPPEKFTEEVLKNLLESYISREGTDYGERELSLEEKVNDLLRNVYLGEALISYDEDSQSVNLISAQEYRDLQNTIDK